MLFPRVKQHADLPGHLPLSSKLTLSAPEGMVRRACGALEAFLPGVRVVPAGETADIRAEVSGALAGEAYTLWVEQDGVRVTCGDYLGLRNALAALSQLVHVRDGGVELPCVRIQDAPACAHRGLMLDLARGVPPFEAFVDDVILAARARMNVLHLHLSDAQGVGVQLDSVPARCLLPGAYSKQQVARLVSLCEVLGLEIIPEYDFPAHAKSLVLARDEFGCRDDRGEPFASPWVLCPGSPGVFEWMESVIDEVCRLFPGRYFHVGGDELFFSAVPKINQLCHWDECAKCRALREREGLGDLREEYYYVMRRLRELVISKGRTMILWNDQIDCARPRPLEPEGVILQYWRVYPGPGRGPVGGSLDQLLDMGYTAISSPYEDTYVDLEEYMSAARLRDWRWDSRPPVRPERAGQIIGSELCAWEYGNGTGYTHYPRTLPPAIALMADKLWTGEEVAQTPELSRAVTRLLLGPGGEGLDLGAALGGLIPPRSEAMARPEQVTLSRTQLEQVRAVLTDSERFYAGDRRRAEIYAGCVDQVLEKTAQ